MEPILVLYATREGQTRRIAAHIAAALRSNGLTVEELNAKDQSTVAIRLRDYAAAVLAASVHAGRHEAEMVAFAKKHLSELDCLPTAFLSVTLSQAGVERADATPEERARFTGDVNMVLDRFVRDTGWVPERMMPVAGALLYTKYNPFIRFIMKRIARKAGAATDTSRDYEYTDWGALDRFADGFARELSSRRALSDVS